VADRFSEVFRRAALHRKMGRPSPPRPFRGLRMAPRRQHGKNGQATTGLGVLAAMAVHVL
jgi:hypothetical protein